MDKYLKTLIRMQQKFFYGLMNQTWKLSLPFYRAWQKFWISDKIIGIWICRRFWSNWKISKNQLILRKLLDNSELDFIAPLWWQTRWKCTRNHMPKTRKDCAGRTMGNYFIFAIESPWKTLYYEMLFFFFWNSSGSYEISSAEGVQPGTKIVLHLRPDSREFSDEATINGQIFVRHTNRRIPYIRNISTAQIFNRNHQEI